MEEKKRGSFRGSLGFVLAAAGSAVGLGNIWRFPYLAARDGGGIFLILYLGLALTFGFALLTTEVAIGRKAKQSPIIAYGRIHKKAGWIGGLATAVPFFIVPYYCVIGGWVTKYFVAFLTGHGAEAAQDGYFTGFISDKSEPIIYTFIFLAVCALIILRGVEKGIEGSSRVIMPILLILVLVIAIYSLTISDTKADGTTVSGIDGLKVYLVPNFEGMTLERFFFILMDALGQLFFSLSVSMGIMVAYGSYVSDDANLVQSINRIEIFDTLVAFLAGIMIIPAIYVFQGVEGMQKGPSLMFVSLPKIFAKMGAMGNVVGTLFFAMVLFAAVTSGMSILEPVVSGMIDKFRWTRVKSTALEALIALGIGVVVCLGYNVLYFEVELPNGNTAQILDLLDYATNNFLMPVIAIATCIFIGWIVKPKVVVDEVTKNGERFRRKKLYIAMIKYIAPALLLVLLLLSTGIIG